MEEVEFKIFKPQIAAKKKTALGENQSSAEIFYATFMSDINVVIE